MPSKTQSPEHAGATLAQKMRKNRDDLAKAELRVIELREREAELLSAHSPEVMAIAKRILGS